MFFPSPSLSIFASLLPFVSLYFLPPSLFLSAPSIVPFFPLSSLNCSLCFFSRDFSLFLLPLTSILFISSPPPFFSPSSLPPFFLFLSFFFFFLSFSPYFLPLLSSSIPLLSSPFFLPLLFPLLSTSFPPRGQRPSDDPEHSAAQDETPRAAGPAGVAKSRQSAGEDGRAKYL